MGDSGGSNWVPGVGVSGSHSQVGELGVNKVTCEVTAFGMPTWSPGNRWGLSHAVRIGCQPK